MRSAGVVLSLLACGPAGTRGALRVVVVQEAYTCGDRREDTALAHFLQNREEELFALLPSDSERVETGAELREAFEAPDGRPLVLFYAGHASDGRGEPPIDAQSKRELKSYLCLRDGPVVVEDLLRRTHSTTPSTALILDGCETARVDVRESPVPTTVLSASDRPLPSGPAGGSALAGYLIAALREGDDNEDGIVDDRELLQRILGEMGNRVTAEPRLRRQADAALPVRTAPSVPSPTAGKAGPSGLSGSAANSIRERERAFARLELASLTRSPGVFWAAGTDARWQAPSPAPALSGSQEELRRIAELLSASEGFALEPRGSDVALRSLRTNREWVSVPASQTAELVRRVTEGHWATLKDEIYVWHGGRVEERVETLEGAKLSGSDLRPIPCPEAFGQCFEVPAKAAAP